MKRFFAITFVIFFIIYFASSPSLTPYDYFTRLGASFLKGNYWLTTNPPWLNELIPSGQGKYYVVYPPMPAILSVPFLLFLGKDFRQDYLSYFVGALTVALTVGVSWKIKKDRKLAIYSGILVGLGSIIWFMSSVGSVWYLGQISGALFLTGSLLVSLSKKNALMAGVLLGGAYLSRLPTILALPLILFLYKENWKNNFPKILMGIAPFLFFNFYYNLIRFGTILDKGYLLIPGVLDETWYQNGLFNPVNIPNHLKVFLGGLPKISNTFPFVIPSWGGMAIWLTTPVFIYSLFGNFKERLVQISWIVIMFISLVIFSHGSTGFAQFGYRFAVDYYPILIFLTIKSIAKNGIKWHHWLLLIISVLVNLWGVVWINKLGWVSF